MRTGNLPPCFYDVIKFAAIKNIIPAKNLLQKPTGSVNLFSRDHLTLQIVFQEIL